MDNFVRRIINYNNMDYELIYFYLDESHSDLNAIACCKLPEKNVHIQFGQAVYSKTSDLVFCKINFDDYWNNPLIDIEKEKDDFTYILNIAKEEILRIKKNRK